MSVNEIIIPKTDDDWTCDRCGKGHIKQTGWEWYTDDGEQDDFSLCVDCIEIIYNQCRR
jgi:hypothetical protein